MEAGYAAQTQSDWLTAPFFLDASLLHIDRLPTTTPANLPPKLPQNSLVSGRQSPLENPNKHKTLHPSISPSSDASRSQECAFPPFPTSKSRSATPTTPSEPVQNFATHHSGQQALGDWNSLFAPSSSQGIGGSVLHRMEKILTGPVGGPRSKGHTRTPTMSSSKDFTYQPIGESGKDYNSRPSTAGSYSSRKPSLSNISKVPRSKFSQTNTDLPRLPIASGNAVRAFPTGDMEDDKSGELVQRKMSIERLRQENRSRTYPLGNLAKEEDGARRPSAPSLHVKRPSVAAAIRPLHEIGSVSTFKPSRSLRGRPRSQVALIISESAAMPIEHRTRRSQKADNAPAVPIFHLSSEDRSENLYRAPAGSTSSHGSSKSGAGSVSSASTPSLSESPPRQKQQPLDAGHNTFTQDFRFEIKAQFNTEEPLSPRGILPAESSTLAPPPVRDPAIHSPRFPPITPFNDCFAALPIASNDLAARPDHTSPPSLVPALKTRRAPFGNKGQCKGCGEFIVGKSVSSADGRLTGRYHKSCFKCATCKEPFRTADFYIHDNHPYCQRHYHQLNQSLCVACDCGIEGQYVETENRQKFHQDCFTCRVSNCNFLFCFCL